MTVFVLGQAVNFVQKEQHIVKAAEQFIRQLRVGISVIGVRPETATGIKRITRQLTIIAVGTISNA